MKINGLKRGDIVVVKGKMGLPFCRDKDSVSIKFGYRKGRRIFLYVKAFPPKGEKGMYDIGLLHMMENTWDFYLWKDVVRKATKEEIEEMHAHQVMVNL